MAQDCPKCGIVSPDGTRACGCGYDFVAEVVRPELARPDVRYRKVGGWLLLFCVGLTILGPLRTLVALAKSYADLAAYQTKFSGLAMVVIVDMGLSAALMALAIHAGVRLWTIRPGAVQTAKRFLLWVLGYHAIAAILPFTAGLPPEANREMLRAVSFEVAGGVIWVAIWYAYLSRSKRVKATYGEPAA
jgi:hypothetical protein